MKNKTVLVLTGVGLTLFLASQVIAQVPSFQEMQKTAENLTEVQFEEWQKELKGNEVS